MFQITKCLRTLEQMTLMCPIKRDIVDTKLLSIQDSASVICATYEKRFCWQLLSKSINLRNEVEETHTELDEYVDECNNQ